MNQIQSLSKFARFSWLMLVLTLFVIVWGGFVSASGSGDGCGDSWPLCGALAESEHTSLETVIEFTHRITSGLDLIGVVVLAIWARRLYPAGNVVRRGAHYTLMFMIIESLLGAGLVVFQWVDTNESLARAFVQPVHLTNTYLLMGSLAITTWWASSFELKKREGKEDTKQWGLLYWIAGGLIGMIIISSFGTIASLASTIFPAESFFEGVQQDFARNVHYLIRLRIWHPILATVLWVYFYMMVQKIEAVYDIPLVGQLCNAVLWLYAGQYFLGAVNAFSLAPVWLQLVHLLVAHLLWLSLVWLETAMWSEA